MAVIAGRTREQLRVAIGQNSGVAYFSSLSLIGGAAGVSIIDNTLRGGDDDHKGKWILITSGARDGDVSRCSAYTASSYTVTVLPAFSTQIASAVTYEMWDELFPPARVNDLINQAIVEITGLAYDPEESQALHADGRQTRFDIPSQFAMLNGIDYRQSVESTQIHLATTAWDEATVANVTGSVDTKDYKRPGGSVKMVVAAGAAAGLVLASKAISSLDISGYTYVEFWIKSTVATASGDLQLLLDNTALSVSPLETLSVPALTANTWTYVRVALATPALDTAIISVGLKYTVDIGAVTLWLNDVQAVNDDSAVWVRLDKNSWRIDDLNQDLILSDSARRMAGYRLLRLRGGDKPLLLTTDSAVNEVDDQFVICRCVELILLAQARGPSSNPDNTLAQASYWGRKADEAKRSTPWLVNTRVTS